MASPKMIARVLISAKSIFTGSPVRDVDHAKAKSWELRGPGYNLQCKGNAGTFEMNSDAASITLDKSYHAVTMNFNN